MRTIRIRPAGSLKTLLVVAMVGGAANAAADSDWGHHRRHYGHHGHHGYAASYYYPPVYQAPPVVYVQPAPVYVSPPPVVYAPVVREVHTYAPANYPSYGYGQGGYGYGQSGYGNGGFLPLAVLGAAGGLLGSQVGSGSGRAAATAAGAVAGWLLGGSLAY